MLILGAKRPLQITFSVRHLKRPVIAPRFFFLMLIKCQVAAMEEEKAKKKAAEEEAARIEAMKPKVTRFNI